MTYVKNIIFTLPAYVKKKSADPHKTAALFIYAHICRYSVRFPANKPRQYLTRDFFCRKTLVPRCNSPSGNKCPPSATGIETGKSGALDVIAAAGIDQEMIPFVDEQRHFYYITGVHGSGLIAAGSGIAADARLGFNNDQFNSIGQFDA